MGQQLMIKSHRWCFKNGVLAATMDGQLTLFDPSHAKFSLLTVPENQVLDLAVSVIMENRLLLGLKVVLLSTPFIHDNSRMGLFKNSRLTKRSSPLVWRILRSKIRARFVTCFSIQAKLNSWSPLYPDGSTFTNWEPPAGTR